MCRDLVDDDVPQRDEQLFVWPRGATESIVRLVDEVPEDVVKLLHIFCTITFADVPDQRRIRRASV